MRNYLIKGLLVLVCVLAPITIKAQSADTTLYVSVNPTTVVAGEWAGVSGVIVNNTAAKVRLTVTFSAVDPCGTKTDLGYNRLALNPGQSVLVTTAYATKTNLCRGIHTITIATGAKGGNAGTSATTNLEVQ